MYEMQRKTSWATLKTGIVISIALFFLFLSVFFSGNISELFSPKLSINAKFSNIQGLRSGAPVWLYGAEIGKISDISIKENGIIVALSLEQKHSKSIYKDAVANIMTMGILGDKFIEIRQGVTKSQLISSGDTINGVGAVDFEQITAAATTTMVETDSVIEQLAILLNSITSSSGTFAKLLNDSSLYKQLTISAANLSNVTKGLVTSDGTIRKLIDDPQLYKNLNDAALQLSNLVGRVDNGLGNGGVASAIINDSTMALNLRETVASLKETAHSINELVADVKKNPKKYFSVKIF
jgi:phospholipid/cholesterol/gamma-HCH transport system substrate-binding protein